MRVRATGLIDLGSRQGRTLSFSLLLLACVSSCGRPTARGVASGPSMKRPVLFLVKEDGKYGYIDRSGRIVIAPQFRSASPFSEGRATVQPAGPGGTIGYIDPSGALVISPRFSSAQEFSEGMAAVTTGGIDGRLSFIDRSGTVMFSYRGLFSGRYSEGSPFSEGLASIHVNALLAPNMKMGFIDRTGRFAIKARFVQVLSFREGLAGAMSDNPHWGRWGFIDKRGAWVIKPQFDAVGSFSDGLAAVRFSRWNNSAYSCQWGYINKAGAMVIKPQRYMWASGFSEGLANVMVEPSRHGFIDKTGTMVIAPDFSRAGDFSEGLAPVRVRGKWGYVNRAGTLVIEPRFQMANGFHDGLAQVDGYAYINTKGEYVWKPRVGDGSTLGAKRASGGGQ